MPVLIPSPHTGVFVTPHKKIGSIGIHIKHRVTFHGFCVNVTDQPLSYFKEIVACGLKDVRATSLQSELGREIQVEDIIPSTVQEFGATYGRKMLRLEDAGEEYATVVDMILRGERGELPPLTPLVE